MENPEYWYIWSNEHKAWWKENSFGYTKKKSEAGRYTIENALVAIRAANRFNLDDGEPSESLVPVEIH